MRGKQGLRGRDTGNEGAKGKEKQGFRRQNLGMRGKQGWRGQDTRRHEGAEGIKVE
jgi:hypothetical protein